MPGPNSAPNGDRSLTTNGVRRSEMREQGKLYTGKTEKMLARGPRVKKVQEPQPKGKKR